MTSKFADDVRGDIQQPQLLGGGGGGDKQATSLVQGVLSLYKSEEDKGAPPRLQEEC